MPLGRVASLGLLLLVLGCSDRAADDAASDGSTSQATTIGDHTEGGDTTVGAVTATGVEPTAESSGGDDSGGSLGKDHGVVTLELQRGASQVGDPFVGTTRVEVTLIYLQCLIDFYDASPQWSQVGPEGAAVFDAALGPGLCEPAGPDFVECSVAQIAQELTVAKSMHVIYDVTGTLEGRLLRFGPLPTSELAGCADGAPPIVRIGSNGAVRGLDAMGNTVWNVESFSPSEAATDQTGPITISVVAPG